jgi:hypothetical protein
MNTNCIKCHELLFGKRVLLISGVGFVCVKCAPGMEQEMKEKARALKEQPANAQQPQAGTV